jgi:hypothetical protein
MATHIRLPILAMSSESPGTEPLATRYALSGFEMLAMPYS